MVLRALQHHGSGPRGAKHQDEVGEEKLSLQVQLECLLLHPLRRLPPSLGVAERRVAHGRRRMRLAGDGSVALATFWCRAGLLTAGGSSLPVGAVGLGDIGAADRQGGEHSALCQVTHTRVTGTSGAAVIHSWTFEFRRFC